MTTQCESNNLGDLLKQEAEQYFSRDVVTLKSGQNLKLGTVVAQLGNDFGGRMKLEVLTLQGVDTIIDAMAVTEKAAHKVAVRVLNDTAKWFKSNAGKEISKETGVPSAFVKKRFFITKAVAQELDAPLCATISVNLYDVRPPHLGALQKTSSGAKAGKFMFDGAFIATMNKKRGPSLYKRKGKERFPVSERSVDIKTKAEPILERLVNEAPAVYEKRFQSQMNYEASKGNAL